MTFGAEVWGPALIQAAASIGSGYLAGRGQASKETKMERTKRKLVDRLLASLNGEGEFADLYKTDQNAFNKSFVEPAQARFRNETAPQIQQQFIASGQQRGTGLEDQLTRAGIDLDSMLNQHMYQFQQDALNRKQGTINAILGGGAGAQNDTTGKQDIFSGLSGYLSSEGFANTTADLFKTPEAKTTAATPKPERKGFEPEGNF